MPRREAMDLAAETFSPASDAPLFLVAEGLTLRANGGESGLRGFHGRPDLLPPTSGFLWREGGSSIFRLCCGAPRFSAASINERVLAMIAPVRCERCDAATAICWRVGRRATRFHVVALHLQLRIAQRKLPHHCPSEDIRDRSLGLLAHRCDSVADFNTGCCEHDLDRPLYDNPV